MSINNEFEFLGMKEVSDAVAYTLRMMKDYAKPGMSTKKLDEFGAQILKRLGAKSAPYETYKFPGFTCISVGNEFCHGIPSSNRILKEGDLINIDVSAELNGYWSDNGTSFVIGKDLNHHNDLVEASRNILKNAIMNIRDGVRISDIGHLIENEAKVKGYKVIKNLTGHGIGRSLHEYPSEIANFRNVFNRQRFKTNMVVAIETFISTSSDFAVQLKDGWTMVGDKGGYMAQHEHTIVVTESEPIILTNNNSIFS